MTSHLNFTTHTLSTTENYTFKSRPPARPALIAQKFLVLPHFSNSILLPLPSPHRPHPVHIFVNNPHDCQVCPVATVYTVVSFVRKIASSQTNNAAGCQFDNLRGPGLEFRRGHRSSIVAMKKREWGWERGVTNHNKPSQSLSSVDWVSGKNGVIHQKRSYNTVKKVV